MLIKAERDQIVPKLAAILAAGASPQNVVGGLFGANAMPVLQAIPTGAPSFNEIAIAVLNFCLADRWLHKPSLLEGLLTELISRGEVTLIPIRDRVQRRVDPNLEMLATSWITAE